MDASDPSTLDAQDAGPRLSPSVRERLRCSACGGVLRDSAPALECQECGAQYGRGAGAVPDMRLRRPKDVRVGFRVGGSDLLEAHPTLEFKPLACNPRPAVDFGSMEVPHHMTRELMSHFPRASGPGSLALDLGCGNGVHRGICEHAGFEWVGIDADPRSAATVLADAHALPFQDASFEFVLSVATLHLVRHPHVVLQEIRRVLRPGGAFIGTVAFLEPFHDGGYYHHTHLGILNSLDIAGFRVHHVAPSAEWTALRAQAQMALFPRMPPLLASAILFPTDILHRMWWRAGRALTRNPNASEQARVRNLTGAFSFVAAASP